MASIKLILAGRTEEIHKTPQGSQLTGISGTSGIHQVHVKWVSCHHSMAHPQAAKWKWPPNMEGNCKIIEQEIIGR
jgi:hypothetical protein